MMMSYVYETREKENVLELKRKKKEADEASEYKRLVEPEIVMECNAAFNLGEE